MSARLKNESLQVGHVTIIKSYPEEHLVQSKTRTRNGFSASFGSLTVSLSVIPSKPLQISVKDSRPCEGEGQEGHRRLGDRQPLHVPLSPNISISIDSRAGPIHYRHHLNFNLKPSLSLPQS
ncbi:hypothetical protein CEXT_737941 [Caerostris extrusa]|uniref:Uncharacterized protein n=1 Tax=Caerostris extrusa TaxID=172846 RepID=A0AAV4Y0Q5_CAEEX|nr:hypothetical protein CEXT_737941 [Caerostris extrusa]